MPTFDLFGQMQPDDFSRSLVSSRPVMKYERPHAAPRTVEIEGVDKYETIHCCDLATREEVHRRVVVTDRAWLGVLSLCKASRDGYLEGSRIKRNGGAPVGSTSPGRDALMGWGDKAPVRGLATLTPPPKIKGPEVITRDLTKLGSTRQEEETA